LRRRIGLAVTLAIWIAALFAPCVQFVHGSPTPLHGYRLAMFGWLGPLELSIAWYANILYFYCCYKLWRGQAPSRRVSTIALAIAWTAFVPQLAYSEVYGWSRAYLTGPAIWLWVGAFAIHSVFAWIS
jgi:hypothetical protein